MKKFKRIMALVIAMAMVLSMMSMAAFAAPQVNSHTVTIDNTDQNVPHSYEIYQIFKGNLDENEDKLSDIQWGSGVNGTGLLNALKRSTDKNLLATAPITWKEGDGTNPAQVIAKDENIFKYCETAQDVAKVLATLSSTATFNTVGSGDDIHGELDGRTEAAGAIDAVAKIIGGDPNDSSNFPGFLADKADSITAGDKAAAFTEGTGDNAGKYTATVLGDGYYFIKDTTAATALTDNDTTASDTLAKYMLTVIRDEIIYAKDTGLTPDKEILNSENATVKADTAAIGDEVHFQVKVKVPNTKKYEDHFWFIMDDALPEGITFTGIESVMIGSLEVKDVNKETTAPDLRDPAGDGTVYYNGTQGWYTLKVGAKDAANKDAYAVPSKDATEVTKYTFEAGSYDAVKEAGGQKLELTFNQFKKFVETNNLIGQDVVIKYKGVVNDDAEYTATENENEVIFEYSNTPNHDYNGDNPTPQDDSVVGKTPESNTRTYTTSLKIFKVDENKQKLAGATFELKGTALNRTVLTGYKFVKEADKPANAPTNGEEYEATANYWKLLDGSYTTTDPATLANTTQYENIQEKWYKVTFDKDEVAAKEVDTVIVTDSNGVAEFIGLNEGTDYTLEEIAAPDGYNKIDGKSKFTITWVDPKGEKPTGMTDDDWNALKARGGYTITESDASDDKAFGIAWNETDKQFEVTIQNQSGSVLPSTGGIGTTIFYVVGAILVIGAGVILITRRRMDA